MKNQINTIDAHELKKRRDDDLELWVIDVRELHEWQALRIPGTLHLPKDELASKIKLYIPQLEKPIYLHCRSGVRSLHAANTLLAMGYKEVYSLEGGITDWALFGYPVEGEKQASRVV